VGLRPPSYPIAAAYPLKPPGTAAPVSLSKGDIGPPRKGRVAGGFTTYLDPGGQLDSLPEGADCAPTRVDQPQSRTGESGGRAEPPSYLTTYLDPGGAAQGDPRPRLAADGGRLDSLPDE